MYLNPSDLETLQARARAQARFRLLWPVIMVADVLMGVAAFLWLEAPVGLLAGAALVAGGVITLVVMRRVTAPGPGAAQAILDGRQPTTSVWVRALGDQGSAPYTWSLELESPQHGLRYLHACQATDADWQFEEGARYQVQSFGDQERPYRGMVLFNREGDDRRHWDASVRPSEEKWNTITAE